MFDYVQPDYEYVVENKYNADGIRTSKIVDGVEHKYYLNGSQIVGETWTSEGIEYLLMYVYDETGSPIAIKYRTNEYSANNFDTFFLEKNLQGDIVAIYDETGVKIGEYIYDAWGNFSSVAYVTDEVTGEQTLEEKIVYSYNPFRYRGYYYDTDTSLYYLQSRYYNAQWGRFLNGDALLDIGAVFGTNLFAYCLNNPVMLGDSFGFCAKAWAAGYSGPCPGQGLPGCMDNWPKFREDSTIISAINPQLPPDHPDYIPPKKNGGRKVRNPNGAGWGWPAKDGGVWMPDFDMHGGEGWTIQYPGGGHSHAYPGGGVRNHFESEQSIGKSIIMIFSGAVLTIGLLVDDITGIGAADDPLLVGSVACFAGGLNGVFGKKVCSECGAVKYGY